MDCPTGILVDVDVPSPDHLRSAVQRESKENINPLSLTFLVNSASENGTSETFHCFTEEDSLPSKIISAEVEDDVFWAPAAGVQPEGRSVLPGPGLTLDSAEWSEVNREANAVANLIAGIMPDMSDTVGGEVKDGDIRLAQEAAKKYKSPETLEDLDMSSSVDGMGSIPGPRIWQDSLGSGCVADHSSLVSDASTGSTSSSTPSRSHRRSLLPMTRQGLTGPDKHDKSAIGTKKAQPKCGRFYEGQNKKPVGSNTFLVTRRATAEGSLNKEPTRLIPSPALGLNRSLQMPSSNPNTSIKCNMSGKQVQPKKRQSLGDIQERQGNMQVNGSGSVKCSVEKAASNHVKPKGKGPVTKLFLLELGTIQSTSFGAHKSQQGSKRRAAGPLGASRPVRTVRDRPVEGTRPCRGVQPDGKKPSAPVATPVKLDKSVQPKKLRLSSSEFSTPKRSSSDAQLIASTPLSSSKRERRSFLPTPSKRIIFGSAVSSIHASSLSETLAYDASCSSRMDEESGFESVEATI